MRLALSYPLLALAALACGDNFTGKQMDAAVGDARKMDAPPDAPAGTTLLRSTLSGTQEVPPVRPGMMPARGAAVLGIDEAKTKIDIELSYENLTGITMAHIHHGKPGVNGGILFTLSGADFASPLVKTLGEADFSATPEIATFAEAVQAILDGETYINVHTTTNTGGEIRGHVGKTTLTAIVSPAQENPRVTATSSGTVSLTLNDEQTKIDVSLDTDMVTMPTAAHIHVAGVGRNGPVIFDLGTFADPLNISLEETMLAPKPEFGVTNMREAVDAILSGHAYVNVHTMANAGGELRGQVGAITLAVRLTGGQERPNPVNTPATGDATVTISGDQSTITTRTTFTGIATTTVAHIHSGAFDAAGLPIFDLATAMYPSPLTKVLTSADFKVVAGVPTFTAAINALIAGDTYINLHSMANSAGQIRGQVGRVVLAAAAMTSGKHLPPVVNPNTETGSAIITIPGDHRSIFATLTYAMLTSATTGATIHTGTPGSLTATAPTLLELTNATFMSGTTFEVAADATELGTILDEGTFANIKTANNTGGELRDQIVAAP